MLTENILPAPTFIPLKNHRFAQYHFVYRINDAFTIHSLDEFQMKHQLLFQKIRNINQQLNLLFVDSCFANILSDLVLEVFLNGTNSFHDYIVSTNKIDTIYDRKDQLYFWHKFQQFIHLLLYSDFAGNKVWTGELFSERVFVLKNNAQELVYYSYLEHPKLQEKLMKEMKLEICRESSLLREHYITLCLNISY